MNIMLASEDTQLYDILNRQHSGDLLPWDINLLTNTDVVIIASPVCSSGLFFSNEHVWKRYLAITHPTIRLICVGWRNILDHPNYIYRLNFPSDFNSFVEDSYICADDWELPLSHGLEVEKILKRILDGHGQTNIFHSCRGVFGETRLALRDLEQSMSPAEINSYMQQKISISARWTSFVTMWQKYERYFNGIPFHIFFIEVNCSIDSLGDFFNNYSGDLDKANLIRIKALIEDFLLKMDKIKSLLQLYFNISTI